MLENTKRNTFEKKSLKELKKLFEQNTKKYIKY